MLFSCLSCKTGYLYWKRFLFSEIGSLFLLKLASISESGQAVSDCIQPTWVGKLESWLDPLRVWVNTPILKSHKENYFQFKTVQMNNNILLFIVVGN